MAVQRTTVRIPEELAARLRRAHFLSKRSQNDIINDALEHWLTNPRQPGCIRTRLAETTLTTGAPPSAPETGV